MNWIDMDVVGVRVEEPQSEPVLLLHERDTESYIAIWIGPSEAEAVVLALSEERTSRPLTHELLLSVLEASGGKLDSIEITGIEEGVYFANLVLSNEKKVPARPSDAIALAIRAEVPVRVSDKLLAEVGVLIPDNLDGPAKDESEVEAFRQFLDQVSPDDFLGEDADDSQFSDMFESTMTAEEGTESETVSPDSIAETDSSQDSPNESGSPNESETSSMGDTPGGIVDSSITGGSDKDSMLDTQDDSATGEDSTGIEDSGTSDT